MIRFPFNKSKAFIKKNQVFIKKLIHKVLNRLIFDLKYNLI